MIELMEHNKETYKRLCDVLEDNNKCALVQATGTGKSYIAGKYIEEHANTALILVPANAIADAWNNLLKGIGQVVDIVTYQTFAKEPQNYLGYDLVIADEMHHLGSDVWGKKFVETYLQSENHKIIGLTATEIRYLDNSRDMAEEIFENIRVDGCDLPTAINTGVLPTFKYVSTLYCDESDFDEWQEKAGKIKDIKTQKELKGKLDVCIKNMVSVKQAVNENLTDDYKKIIVFLNNVEAKETALGMFKDVFPTANFYDVDYSMKRAYNNSQIEKFKADKSRAVLFAVDMLNEGVHIKGTDCIIMFRKTVSPQVYLQQLGRGLASGTGKMPIIFDFVSNVNSIAGKHNLDSDSEESNIIHKWNKKISKEKQIIIKNYILEIQDVISKIRSQTEHKPWADEEIKFLKQNYNILSRKQLLEKLGRSVQSIQHKAKELGLTNNTNKEWTKQDIEFLANNYKNMSYKEIGKFLNRSVHNVKYQASKLGISKSRLWTDDEIKFLSENYNKMKHKEIAKELGRTETQITNKIRNLDLARKVPKKEEIEEYIKRNYKNINSEEKIASELGIKKGTVIDYVLKMGLRKRSAKLYAKEEINFIRENHGKIMDKEIAQKLNRPASSISRLISKLGINKK